MNILCVTANFEHPMMGGSTRYYHFIRELSQRHRITLLARAKTKVQPSAMEEMARYTEQVLTFESSGERDCPSTARIERWLGFSRRMQRAWLRWNAIGRMRRAFAELTQQGAYDLVLFRGEDVFPVVADLQNLPLVIDVSDAHSARLRQGLRYANAIDFPWRLLRFLQVKTRERKFLGKTPHLAFISGRDRDALHASSSQARVIPNGVDLNYWARKSPAPLSHCIVFSGVMTYPPNVDAVLFLLEKILPLVRRSVPDVEVIIVGRDPSQALTEAVRRHPGVILTGYVEDVRPYLERASVFAAPLRFASGMQNKVLEALAMQVPVVTTSVVIAGLREQGREAPPIVVADDERSFAERLVNLLENAAERSRMATAGHAYVLRHFNWSRSAALLEEMCLEAIAIGPAGRSQC